MEEMGLSYNPRKDRSYSALIPKKDVTELQVKYPYLTFKMENIFLSNESTELNKSFFVHILRYVLHNLTRNTTKLCLGDLMEGLGTEERII
jgi:hypothetical protein